MMPSHREQCVCCSKYGECVSNNNNETGFVTALIFSVVTEQTIGERHITSSIMLVAFVTMSHSCLLVVFQCLCP